MADADIAQTGLAQAVARFPEAAASAARDWRWPTRRFARSARSMRWRRESLARFEARSDAAERPEIGDYRTVIAELEGEIDRFLREAGPRG